MICRIRFSFIAASIMLATSVQALETNIEAVTLPFLQPEPQHETASKRITRRFENSHYKAFELNDAFSSLVFERYLNTIDYNRQFFTQVDIDNLSKWRLKIDDQLRTGDTSAAFSIFNLSMQKRLERYRYAISLLNKEITFNADESILIDASKEPWLKNTTALNEMWRKRVKNDALNLKLAGKTWPEIKKTLSKRYQTAIKQLTQTKSEDVFQIYLNAFAREVDPHTSYLSPRNAEQFQSEMNLSLEGIGAVLQSEDDFTIIRSLVAGGPASKSKKLSVGDRIISVAQEDKKFVDVIGWRLDDVVQLIKGPKGTKVLLEILGEGANEKSHTVTLYRDKIRLEDLAVKSEILEKDGKKVGVISVPSFYVNLAEDTKKEIAKLKKENITGIVIDLRNNGGGALSEASAFTGLFIEDGPIVQVRDSYGRVKINRDSDNKIYYAGPLTVLINRYSASASEIFAAAVQDYGRAVILGEQSFGKGTVQQHRSLNHIYDIFSTSLGHVQYTIQKFYRINGGSTQNKGVVPHIPFPTAVDASETGESVEENALPWDKINSVVYKKVGDLKPHLARLETTHQERIKNNAEFGFLLDDIKQYKRIVNENYLSLNEKKRLSERERLEKERLARINSRQRVMKKPTYKSLDDLPNDYEDPDVFLQEAVAITIDLAKN